MRVELQSDVHGGEIEELLKDFGKFCNYRYCARGHLITFEPDDLDFYSKYKVTVSLEIEFVEREKGK